MGEMKAAERQGGVYVELRGGDVRGAKVQAPSG
jgi:hypothetical protein